MLWKNESAENASNANTSANIDSRHVIVCTVLPDVFYAVSINVERQMSNDNVERQSHHDRIVSIGGLQSEFSIDMGNVRQAVVVSPLFVKYFENEF